MQKFQDYLVEDKNTHLEHLEDEIINNGSKGAKTAIEFLKSIKAQEGQQSQLNGMVPQQYFVVSIQRMVDSLLAPNLSSIKHLK